jgi:hypothetical protein
VIYSYLDSFQLWLKTRFRRGYRAVPVPQSAA